MLWLTLRQLKSGSTGARRKAAKELWWDPTDPRGISALAVAVTSDSDSEVRQIAASALGRSRDPGRYEPLLKALRDKHPDVIHSAMIGLRRASDERVIPALVQLLGHPDFSV